VQAFVAGEGRGEAVGELVRGGLYEVDLLRRRMGCVYWPEAARRVCRGTWFVEKGADWVPLKVTGKKSSWTAFLHASLAWHAPRHQERLCMLAAWHAPRHISLLLPARRIPPGAGVHSAE
jgi:hypothetical protein